MWQRAGHMVSKGRPSGRRSVHSNPDSANVFGLHNKFVSYTPWQLGTTVGPLDGVIVGSEVVGAAVGPDVVGKAVGPVVGFAVGFAVGSELVGEIVGDAVGSVVVGPTVGERVGARVHPVHVNRQLS